MDGEKKLIPVIKNSDKHLDLTQPDKGTFQAFNGEYHLAEIDKEGNEILGTDFSIGESTFFRAYSELIGKSFIVIKNPRQ